MGAGSGNNWGGSSGSIVITNYTDAPIDVTAVESAETEGTTRRAIEHTINPRDSYVLFTNKIEALSWERSK